MDLRSTKSKRAHSVGFSTPDANNGAQCATPQKNASFQEGVVPAPRHSFPGKSLKNRKQTPFKSDSQKYAAAANPKLSCAFSTNKVFGSGPHAFGFGVAPQNENNNPNDGAEMNATFGLGSSSAPAFHLPNNKTSGIPNDGDANDQAKRSKSAPFAFDGATANDKSCKTPLKSAEASSEASSDPFLKQDKTDTGKKLAKGTPKVETVEENESNAPKMGSSNPFTGDATPMFAPAPPAPKTETVSGGQANTPKKTVGSKQASPVTKEGGFQSKMPYFVDTKKGQPDSFKAPLNPTAAVEKKAGITSTTGTCGEAKAKHISDASIIASSGADDKTIAQTDVEASLITWKILSYKECSVEDILTMIRDELQVDAATYYMEAKKVLENEIAIRTMEQDLTRAATASQKTMVKQEDLFQTFATIEAFQSETDSTLMVLENQVDQMLEAHASQPPTYSDYDRELIFKSAQETANAMDQLENDAKAAEASMALLWPCSEEKCLHSARYFNDMKQYELEVRLLALNSSIEELERIFN